ncbi:MAG: hypothetical protein CEE40_04160 [Chloroflexi bacterium B3_Chlor]|nr:MAG: hypothetical protein CEE40_04160 [Chloroflexi bacterium B3_Chlor]
MLVGWGGDAGVAGGSGAAVGASGVDSSECGDGVVIGVSVPASGDPLTVFSPLAVGVQLSTAITLPPLLFVKVESAAQAPTHITKRTKTNAIAEPLFCIRLSRAYPLPRAD